MYHPNLNSNYSQKSLRNIIVNWWKSIDIVVFIISIGMIIFGTFFIFLNSKYVAINHNWDQHFFAKKHLFFATISIFVMIFLSLLKKDYLLKLLLLILLVSVILTLFTSIFGIKIKGARRWISILGFSLQSSEFLKPTLPIFTAYIIQQKSTKFLWIYAIIFGSLLKQPDFGMTFILIVSIFCQLYVSNFDLKWIGLFILGFILIILFSYFAIPNVTRRVNIFISSFYIDDRFGSQFQIYKSIQTISSGGITGKGIGYGLIKKHLPDLHADFIFAGIAEDCGYIVCVIIILAYFTILLRFFLRIINKKNDIDVLYVIGLCGAFAVQIIINLFSNIGIIPPKGTTLPFISYGGSSVLSCAILIGSLLNLTKKEKESILVKKVSSY